MEKKFSYFKKRITPLINVNKLRYFKGGCYDSNQLVVYDQYEQMINSVSCQIETFDTEQSDTSPI